MLNIELCGGRGSLEFPLSCNLEGGIPRPCLNSNYAKEGDCCYDYMTNADKSDEAVASTAFFNISWIKVWQ